MVYGASTLKRRRATKAEMEERARFLLDYAQAHGPVTVRGLYYQATVAQVPGIEKVEAGYRKVQAQTLKLRRDHRMPYNVIADATRYMRKPRSFDGWEDALRATARTYRKALWADSKVEVEIWLEKSALAGVLYPVTADFDVPLMPTGGQTSETFAFEAVEAMRGTGRRLVVYALYDFDASGASARESLREKVERFGREYGVPVEFHGLGLTLEQVRDMGLPTRPHKRNTALDRKWPHDFAAELDAIPPDTLRAMVREAIERHLPAHELQLLKQVEESERELLLKFVEGAA